MLPWARGRYPGRLCQEGSSATRVAPHKEVRTFPVANMHAVAGDDDRLVTPYPGLLLRNDPI